MRDYRYTLNKGLRSITINDNASHEILTIRDAICRLNEQNERITELKNRNKSIRSDSAHLQRQYHKLYEFCQKMNLNLNGVLNDD